MKNECKERPPIYIDLDFEFFWEKFLPQKSNPLIECHLYRVATMLCHLNYLTHLYYTECRCEMSRLKKLA